MHELVMQHVSSLEPGKPLPRSRGKSHSQASSSTQTRSLSIGFTSSVGILDTFLKYNAEEICALPIFYFAQVAHASISLIKMYYVAKADMESVQYTPVTSDTIQEYLGRLSHSLRSADGECLPVHTSLKMIMTIQTLFDEHKDSTLETIKARYSGVPSLRGTQLIELGEPQPTPQQRTMPQGSADTADEALHLLSAVATGKTDVNGYHVEGGQMPGAGGVDGTAVDGETAAMGQLIGEGEMGFMSDDGFIGIMQRMWARST